MKLFKKAQEHEFLMTMIRYLLYMIVALGIMYLLYKTAGGHIAEFFKGGTPPGGVG